MSTNPILDAKIFDSIKYELELSSRQYSTRLLLLEISDVLEMTTHLASRIGES